MLNKEKVIEVYKTISTNQSFNDKEMVELLMILSPKEFDYLIEYVGVSCLDSKLTLDLMRIKPLVEVERIEKIEAITNSEGYKFYLDCLKKGEIDLFLTEAKKETIADLKNLFNMTSSRKSRKSVEAVSKLISEIELEITNRDKERKKNFQVNPSFR